MGAYAPAPTGTRDLADRVRRTILEPIVEGLSRLGNPFHGVLYAGLMIVRDELKVLEFNARLGDPEAQVVLPLVKTDLLEILTAVAEHRLDRLTIDWHERAAGCVGLAAPGYPGSPTKGIPIHRLAGTEGQDDLLIFHARTAGTPRGGLAARRRGL